MMQYNISPETLVERSFVEQRKIKLKEELEKRL
jgi:hypothetical protein